MIGLSVVNSASKSWSGMPCGCSLGDCNRIRFTTLITRTFTSGAWRCSKSTAASVSKVGTSPAQAITTSGSTPRSLLAHSQMPRPSVLYRRVHVEPLQLGLLAGHDNVDVVAAAQAVVGHREQGVCIRGQVDPNDLGLFVDGVIDEAGVLVG